MLKFKIFNINSSSFNIKTEMLKIQSQNVLRLKTEISKKFMAIHIQHVTTLLILYARLGCLVEIS